MGLDQFLYKKPKSKEIGYWRKHNRLQGWMQNLYENKGGDGTFNCVDLDLTMDDLDMLERDIKNDNLPKTQGFFFGDDSYDYEKEILEQQKKEDLEIVEEAKKAIREGYTVVYNCWW